MLPIVHRTVGPREQRMAERQARMTTDWFGAENRGKIVQIAYAVDDVRSGAERFHDLTGAGPFFVRDHIAIDARSHDGPAVFDHSNACGQWGDVMVELVTHHELSPETLDRAMRREHPGFHHVAYFVEDREAEIDRLLSAGAALVVTGTAGATRFAFVAPGEPLNHLLEFYEPASPLIDFYRRVRMASIGWDGSRPVRERAELDEVPLG
jgi:catechol 2,3-dioxygenase-like lactoylglutathione lyase family enzyme